MKERILGIVKTYALLVAVFILQKPLFMLYYRDFYPEAMDWWRVMWHGLPLDLSLAGYLTIVPAMFYIVSVWRMSQGLRRLWCAYFLFLSVLLSVIFTVDVALYAYWGFRLDSTPLFYLLSSPADALASLTIGILLVGLLAMAVYALLLYGLFFGVLLRRRSLLGMKMPYRRVRVSALLLLLLALLFIPIRGGFTVSTMNSGKVYFSTDVRLNHAAINPAFSLMESLSKQKDFAAQYRFMADEEAERHFRTMVDPAVCGADTLTAATDTLLTEERPDILFVILESFSSRLMTSLGGEAGIAPRIDNLAGEGVLFTHIHANSFRTDRGLVAILSGYPAQPTTSIMKYPRKTTNLPSIAGSLREAGYVPHYYYGGDADFTNMRSYLMSSGFEKIVSDVDFPVSERLSKWGVHDHLVFGRLLEDLRREAADTVTARRPHFRVLQTSSSHEPFEVPYHRLQNERLNAFAYTDSCLGAFVEELKRLPQWKNTLLVLVPDHVGCYPERLDNMTVERYEIPLLWLGGAVREPRRVDTYGSQHDLAATLLAQLGLPHAEFTFSKNLLNPQTPHFAFFTVPDAFGVVTTDSRLIYDCQSEAVMLREGEATDECLLQGKAYLQRLYDDLAKR